MQLYIDFKLDSKYNTIMETKFNLQLIRMAGFPNLTPTQLIKLSTPRLLNIYKKTHGFNYGGYCSCGCKESIINVRGTEEDKQLRITINQEIENYKTFIKSILDQREHIQ